MIRASGRWKLLHGHQGVWPGQCTLRQVGRQVCFAMGVIGVRYIVTLPASGDWVHWPSNPRRHMACTVACTVAHTHARNRIGTE